MADDATFDFQLPTHLAAGVYANLLGVWHTGHEFTLDFATTQPAQQVEDGVVVIPATIVTRIKVPPGLVFDIIKTLNENMTTYERTFGEIKPPEPRAGQESPEPGDD
ncbi:MAG TPA: DUF3467 domain-containing protein [Actinomycetota bacterium]|nr:DUF3467 domain-containing protein [Actinomycetota bacterium]